MGYVREGEELGGEQSTVQCDDASGVAPASTQLGRWAGIMGQENLHSLVLINANMPHILSRVRSYSGSYTAALPSGSIGTYSKAYGENCPAVMRLQPHVYSQ